MRGREDEGGWGQVSGRGDGGGERVEDVGGGWLRASTHQKVAGMGLACSFCAHLYIKVNSGASNLKHVH